MGSIRRVIFDWPDTRSLCTHCTLHTANCKLHTAHCKLHTAHCTLDLLLGSERLGAGELAALPVPLGGALLPAALRLAGLQRALAARAAVRPVAAPTPSALG